MSVTKRDDQYHTYADYLVWSRTYGDELINGTAYVREPPAPSVTHQRIAFEMAYQLRGALAATELEIFIAPTDVRLPKSTELDEAVDTVVQPDILITQRDQTDARSVRSAPQWLAEVLSPSTARHDRKRKIPAYERAGVPEVWLIDPDARTVTIYLLSEGRYAAPTVSPLQGKTQLIAVPGATIDWDEIITQIRRRNPDF